MSGLTRRFLLRVAGVGLTVGLGGCLTDGPGGDPTDGSGDDPTDGHRTDLTDAPRDSPTSTDEPATATENGVEYAVRQVDADLPGGDWYDAGSTGHVALYASAEAARADLDLDTLSDERREELAAFVDGVDFTTSRLLYVASVGPDTCYDEVSVSNLRVAGDELVGEASAVDTSSPGEACGDAITYPAALVRVRFDGAPRDAVRLTVTDGWGEAGTVESRATTPAIDPETLHGHVRPEGDPSTVPPELVCEAAGFQRHATGFSGTPPWGETDDWGNFALRVDRLTAGRGETVTVALTNLGPGEAATGNREKYNLQVYTEAGWQDVRGFEDTDTYGYTDEAVLHDQGEGFEWTFELTPEGVVAGHAHEDALSVCPGLPAGRYRFVFWEPTVGVAFDLVE